MRNGMICIAVAAASALAMGGCGNGASGGGTGGTGGSSSSGGTSAAGGSSSNGGAGGVGGSSVTGGQSGGGTTGGGTVTTLSGSKTLGALSTEDATKLCDDTYAYFGTAVPKAIACKWKGVSYATSSSAPTEAKLQSNCTSKETPCLADSGSPVNPGCGDLPSTCKATVEEYSACIRDEAATFIQTVGGLPSCATFNKTGTDAVWSAMGANPPASCLSLSDKCPDLSPPILLTM